MILQLLNAIMTHTRSPQLHARALAALAHLATNSDNCSLILSSGGLYRIAAVSAAYPDVPDIQRAALNVHALVKTESYTGDRKALDVGYNTATISSTLGDNVSALPGLFQCIRSCIDTHTTSVETQRSAHRLLVSIAALPLTQAALSTPAWLHWLKRAMAGYRHSFELQDHACTVLLALPPLSDVLAQIVLPGVIAAVQAHPQGRVQSAGYGFLLKYKHLRAVFFECEGGAEVYDIIVSCATSCLLLLMLIRNGQRCGS